MKPTIEEIREWARRKRSDYLRALDLPVVLPFGVQDIVIIDALLSLLDEREKGGVSEAELQDDDLIPLTSGELESLKNPPKLGNRGEAGVAGEEKE